MLDSSRESVTSALKRARATLERRRQTPGGGEPPPAAHSAAEQEIVERLTVAYEIGDLEGVVALLTDDGILPMPPGPLEYEGRDLASRFFATVALRDGRTFRLVATRANGQPAFGVYVRDRQANILHANGLLVVTLVGDLISGITRFDNSVLPRFGLPRTLPDEDPPPSRPILTPRPI